ncbi:MAG: polyphosphate kinase 1 [Haloarculaceae archaeon]
MTDQPTGDGEPLGERGVATYDASDGPAEPPSSVADTEAETDAFDPDDPVWYLNRELSELAFHQRVLHEATDERNPLLERVRFLAIVTRNLDEFFMKRVGGLKQQIEAGVTGLSPDGRTPREQWAASLETARGMFAAQSACFREVRSLLADASIHLVDHDELTAAERSNLREYFDSDVLPTLTPLTFDPAHPFPFISNLSLSLAVRTRRDGGEPKFSRVKIPENRPRLVRIREAWTDREAERFVPLEQVVAANLDLLFPDVEVLDHATFSVTRNAEVRRNEDVAEGLIEMIEGVLRDRRFATVVRLEVAEGMPEAVRELLQDQLGLDEREVFERSPPLDLRGLSRLVDLDRPDLTFEPWTPRGHPRIDDPDEADLFAEIRRKDVLVHHPYHSFDRTVQAFLERAATDEDVLAIKLAIYRTARDSRVIESLIEAARNGKQVAVMVELKARFDEENNLKWVRRLEEEGIHVAYGTIGLKAHAKVALVVRDEPDPASPGDRGVRLYSHVGTGNYHAETAKLYTDVGVLTADREVGADLTRVFNYFTGHSMTEEYRKLLVAPGNMRARFTELLRQEAEHAREGRPARIVAKMNSLEDPAMVAELYRASRAGVDVDLIVRGICRLRPGVGGVSENVTVRSVVGRFLEHSRVFRFENDGDPEFYLGSADWMTRNLDRRVEVVTPVVDPDHRAELEAILEVLLGDNRRAWRMDADGDYKQLRPGDDPEVEAHQLLMDRAAAETPIGAPPDLPDIVD